MNVLAAIPFILVFHLVSSKKHLIYFVKAEKSLSRSRQQFMDKINESFGGCFLVELGWNYLVLFVSIAVVGH